MSLHLYFKRYLLTRFLWKAVDLKLFGEEGPTLTAEWYILIRVL